MTAQAGAWAAAGAAWALALIAALADRARQRRRNLDRVGFMPWQLISILSFFAALGLTALAVNL